MRMIVGTTSDSCGQPAQPRHDHQTDRRAGPRTGAKTTEGTAPTATLNTGILWEIQQKGAKATLQKVEPGKFALTGNEDTK